MTANSCVSEAEDFVASLGMSTCHTSLAKFLVGTPDELVSFKDCVKRSRNKPTLAVLEMRRLKVQSSTLNNSEFQDFFRSNPRLALESLFCHPVTDWELAQVNERIDSGRMSLQELFSGIREHPSYRLIKFIK